MSEIITLSAGGCGVNVGISFWEQLAQRKAKQSPDSHKVYYERLYDIDRRGKEKPRALFIDTDIKSNILVSCSKVGFDTNLIFGYGGSCRNLYSQGRFGIGLEQQGSYCEALRRQVEKCDAISGFLLIKSGQGGAGSGINCILSSYIRNHFGFRILQQIDIMSGLDSKNENINMNALQVYNTILSYSHKCYYGDSDMYTVFQNNSIEKILLAKKINPTYKQINKYIGKCLNEHINPYIESGSLNLSQRKRTLNLCPLPSMRHVCGGLSQPNSSDHVGSSLQLSNRTVDFSNLQPDQRIYSLNVNVRDNNITQKQVNQSVNMWKKMSNCNFIKWVDSFNLSICRGDKQNKGSTWTLYNGSAIAQNYRKIVKQFSKLCKKKAYYHHYLSKHLEEHQFGWAQTRLNQFLNGYEQKPEQPSDQQQNDY